MNYLFQDAKNPQGVPSTDQDIKQEQQVVPDK